ncbi:MAG: fluoride efflux transporter CrcB [Spirochaetaceae bacterium]|jgi:CrcB protein|nr:fluoride efflux transporter CrcB [Spirochaetaceae bacterium]
MLFIAIGIGGGLGALLRYLSIRFVNAFDFFHNTLPWGTVAVNCLGSFLIGFLTPVFAVCTPPLHGKALLITGFLGGYTTFSTYTLETAEYFMRGALKQALCTMLLQNVLGIAFVMAGMALAKLVLKIRP